MALFSLGNARALASKYGVYGTAVANRQKGCEKSLSSNESFVDAPKVGD
jgi:hypothetical protein